MTNTITPSNFIPVGFDLGKELMQCAQNPTYFIETYVKVQSPLHGIIPFTLQGKQGDFIYTIDDSKRLMAANSRQVGTTTMSAAYTLWYALFNYDKNIILTGAKLRQAQDNLQMIRMMYDHLPEWLKPQRKVNNKTRMTFDNGVNINAVAVNGCSIRGYTVSMLWMDNPEFVNERDMDEFWLSSVPSLAHTNSRLLITSSAGYLKGMLKHWWLEDSDLSGMKKVSLKREDVVPPSGFSSIQKNDTGCFYAPYIPLMITSTETKYETKGRQQSLF